VILQLYLLRQLALSIAFALAGLGFLVVPAITVQAVQKLGGAGLWAVVHYIPLVLIELVPYLAPIAFLLGVVATFGRLASDNEWTAMASAGVNPLRTLAPGLLLAVGGMLITYHLLATVSPEWKYAQRLFVRNAEVDAFQSLGKGRTQFEIGDFFVDAAGTDGAGTFYEAILGMPLGEEEDEEGSDAAADAEGEEDAQPGVFVVVADAIRITFEGRVMRVSFQHARAMGENQELTNEAPFYRLSLDDLVGEVKKSREQPKFLTNEQLRSRLAGEVPEGGKPLDEKHREDYRFEIQRRLALSSTYVVFLLLGAATGLWLRKGTQLGALSTAVGFALLYYILSMKLGAELAEVRLLPLAVAAWATNALFLAAGLILTWKFLWR
jgi:lipopolysaccharide export LptBFGC system permease protein LptF